MTTLTTVGAAFMAACRKLTATPAGLLSSLEDLTGATATVGSGSACRQVMDWIHCGLNVDTTNSTATATVTVCEKISQVLRMCVRHQKGPVMIDRNDLQHHLQELLEVDRFKDYGPNGLQVEGKPAIRKVVTGVTASLALIDAAIAAQADALIVHHGLFWRGQDGRITGWMKQRLARLLAHDINLFAYHLPLDAHASLGNNAQWGQRLGLVADGTFAEQGLGFIGPVPDGLDVDGLAARIQHEMGRAPTVVPGDGRALKRAAWCSGGAQGYFEQAIAAGADVFLTGEISEPQAHYARETGVAFMACGHHASERYGIQAIGQHLAARLGVEHAFFDIDNPA